MFQSSVKSLSSKPVRVDVMFSSLISSVQCVYARHVMQGNTSFSTNLELQISPLCIIQISMRINDLLVIEAPGAPAEHDHFFILFQGILDISTHADPFKSLLLCVCFYICLFPFYSRTDKRIS